VPNIANLILPSFIPNEINLSWSIILSKLIETVIIELRIVFVFIKSNVLSGVFGSSVVSKPDIIPGVSYLVRC